MLSIRPGYSGGSSLTSSSRRISSSRSSTSTAARLSWSWASRLAPRPARSPQPWAPAVGLSTSSTFHTRSSSRLNFPD
ncbi:hypothetical protein, partial [Amycolatopsis sacchari]|uniref:hypothetical protein n=1 Tax=Amycolatopsis sacchari TaxID=115433 RepID=UPI003EB7F6B3